MLSTRVLTWGLWFKALPAGDVTEVSTRHGCLVKQLRVFALPQVTVSDSTPTVVVLSTLEGVRQNGCGVRPAVLFYHFCCNKFVHKALSANLQHILLYLNDSPSINYYGNYVERVYVSGELTFCDLCGWRCASLGALCGGSGDPLSGGPRHGVGDAS